MPAPLPRRPPSVRPSDMLIAFFVCAVALLVAAAALGVAGALTGWDEARLLALHLAFVGGVSQLIVGAAQFFACAFLATELPPRRLLLAQLVTWNAGAIAAALGVAYQLTPLAGAGGTLILAGLALFVAGLRAMRRRSIQRAPWATRWYLAAAAFLAVGAALGPVMAADVLWTRGSLLGAHLALNLGGWFGTAIVGTLHTFYPSLTGTRLQHPRLQLPTFVAWCAGVTLVAGGSAFGVAVLAVAGWSAAIVAGVLLCVNLLASTRAARQHTLPGLLVGAAQLMLPALAAAGLLLTLDGGPFAALTGEHRVALAVVAVAGWIGLTVVGSLAHLLRVMVSVKALGRPTRLRSPRPATVALLLLATAAVDALAAATVLDHGALIAVCAVPVVALYAVAGATVVRQAVRAAGLTRLRL